MGLSLEYLARVRAENYKESMTVDSRKKLRVALEFFLSDLKSKVPCVDCKKEIPSLCYGL